MLIPLLASALLGIGVAASAALGLLIVLFIRQAKRMEALTQELSRVATEHRDGAADVRKRLEEGAREAQAVHAAIKPVPAAIDRVAAVASTVETLREGVAAQAPVLEAVGGRLERIEAQVCTLESKINEVAANGSEGVALVREEWSQIESMIERSERQLAAFEAGRDQEAHRLEELRSAVGTLRGTVEDKIDAQEDRLAVLEEGPQSQIANAAAGLDPMSGDASAAPDAAENRAAAGGHTPIEPKVARVVEPQADRGDVTEEDESAARWIFFVLAALLGLALLAQWLQMK